jgi:DNA-binding NarL/FixJ family response regulator
MMVYAGAPLAGRFPLIPTPPRHRWKVAVMSEPIRVLIADDHDLMRTGLRLIVEQSDDLVVVGEVDNGRGAVDFVRGEQVDVVLMDIRMPGMDGIEATEELTCRGDGPRVLIVTSFELDECVLSALRAGASGFLLKRTPPEQLLDAVRQVHRGDALLAPSVTRRLIDHVLDGVAVPAVADPRLDRLTDREREVLVVMAKGWSNAEIGERFFIADNTVKTHVKRVLTKLGARDRVQAVVIAYEGGLMSSQR